MGSIIPFVLIIAGYYGIFQKAKRPGLFAIIPIYNLWVLLEIIGRPRWWVIFLGIFQVLNIVGILRTVGVLDALVPPSDLSFAFLATSAISIPIILIVGIFMVHVLFGTARALAKSFGRNSQLYILGLVFLQPIFLPELGFNKKVQYVGRAGEEVKAVN